MLAKPLPRFLTRKFSSYVWPLMTYCGWSTRVSDTACFRLTSTLIVSIRLGTESLDGTRAPIRRGYLPLSARAGMKTLITHVSLARGASERAPEPTTTDHPSGMPSEGSSSRESRERLSRENTRVMVLPGSRSEEHTSELQSPD